MKLAASLLLTVAAVLIAQQGETLKFQERKGGAYFEGVRTFPNSDAKLDLVSVLIDRPVSQKSLPPALKAAFYLPEPAKVCLTVRELDNRYNYWLEKDTESGWNAQTVNSWLWSTETVLRWLDFKRGPLRPAELGALVRLGCIPPDQLEQRVVPAALSGSTLPATVESYRFTFKPNVQTSLQFELFAGDSSRAVAPAQPFPDVAANQPVDTFWDVKTLPEGWHRLVATFYDPEANRDKSLVVRFYHRKSFDAGGKTP